MKKMTIIGGASVRAVFFAHELAKRAGKLGITKLCLLDPDVEKLRRIGAVARYAVSRVTNALTVELETDTDRAIAGTDYFVTTIRVGGDASRVQDEEIAQQFGLLGQETTGVGGFLMAARSIPVLVEYCRKIQEKAPDAWIFNFTNPSGLVTQALRQKGFDRVIGICDTPSSTKLRIAHARGLDNDRFYMEFFGLNHLSFAHKAVYEGQDILSDLVSDPTLPEQVGELAMFDPGLIELLGCIPNEYLYYYFYRNEVCGNIRAAGNTRARMVEQNNRALLDALGRIDLEQHPEEGLRIYLKYMFRREETYMSIETTKKVLHPPETLEMPNTQGYAGVAMDFIEAMAAPEGRDLILSVPNGDAIPGLAPDDVIEVTCRVSSAGAQPVPIGPVDPMLFSLISAVKAFERLAVQAIDERSVRLAVKALVAHPLIGDYKTAEGVIHEFLKQNPEHMWN